MIDPKVLIEASEQVVPEDKGMVDLVQIVLRGGGPTDIIRAINAELKRRRG